MTNVITDLEENARKKQDVPRRLSHALTGKFLRDWHSALDTTGSEKGDNKGLADRGDRALLRRCRSIDEVLRTPVFYDVRQKLAERVGVEISSEYDNQKLAAIIGLLAWVKTNDESRYFSKQLAGRRKDSKDASLSGLRFRKLLQIDEMDRLYEELIGVIRILGGTINVPSFVKDISGWRPDTSCYVRKRWAEIYYTTAPEET